MNYLNVVLSFVFKILQINQEKAKGNLNEIKLILINL